MKLSTFQTLLKAHPEKPFHLVLPNQNTVPISFHITEVAHIQKRFIDCGGTVRATDVCQLQAWEGADTDHRLLAGKMAKVLDLARVVLPENHDLDIEVEYEDSVISQYPVADYLVTDDAVVLQLAHKHTDCLAKETCCPTPTSLPMAMAPASGCCGSTASNCCS